MRISRALDRIKKSRKLTRRCRARIKPVADQEKCSRGHGSTMHRRDRGHTGKKGRESTFSFFMEEAFYKNIKIEF